MGMGCMESVKVEGASGYGWNKFTVLVWVGAQTSIIVDKKGSCFDFVVMMVAHTLAMATPSS